MKVRPALLIGFLLMVPACRLTPRRIVVLITVDTLRADHLGAYGNTHGLTPNLDRLASRSLVFDAAFTPVPSTLPAVAALMTSRYPEEVGIDSNQSVLSAKAPTMAAWFAARGWRTGAVVGNFILREASGVNAGFDRYHARFPQAEIERGLPERTARPTTRASLALLDELIEESGRPIFLWVHYQDPHGPYTPPEPYDRAYLPLALTAPDARRSLRVSSSVSGEGAIPNYQVIDDHRDPAFYRARYMGEVAYADQMIGRLLDGIAARGLGDQTVLVFAADHGEGMGEDDYWFAHGALLTEPLVRVPLFLHVPGRAPGRRADTASLLDVFPTLAAHFQGPHPQGARGRDLLATTPETHPSSVYLNNRGQGGTLREGLVDRGYKYVIARGPDPTVERLVRIGSDGHDLSAERPDLLAMLRSGLKKAQSELRPIGPIDNRSPSREDQDALRALGYLQ